jgi:predicted metal-dependent hydrolase
MPFLLRRAAPDLPVPDRLDLAAGSLPVMVRRNPRAKRMILRLAAGGTGVVVTAPRSASPRMIGEFLERHRGWVESRLSRVPPSVAVADGAVLKLRGEDIRLVHRPEQRASHFEQHADGHRLLVGRDARHFVRRVADALKREARRDLEAAVGRHAAAVGLAPRAITLKDTRSRWGSCTADRRLAFSWRIVMAPPPVLDYLAAHEVAHFREMNHGPGFWTLCRDLCPGTDYGRDWLKRHGAQLHAIDFAPR